MKREDLEMLSAKSLPRKITKAREDVRKGKVLMLAEVKAKLQLSAKRLGIGAVVLLAAVTTLAAATDVSGEWIYVVKNNLGTFRQTFALKQQGTEITGHILSPRGQREEIRSGKISGDDIEFTVLRTNPSGDKPTPVTYKGKVGGDEMKGYFMGPGGHRQEWTAKRAGAR